MKRSEIQDKYKWHLEDMVSSDEEWERLFSECEKEIPVIASYKGKLGNRKDALALLNLDTKCSVKTEAIYVYSNMRLHEDGSITKYAEMAARANSLIVHISAASSYVSSELLALPEETLKSYIEDKDFADYDFMLKTLLRNKEHTLSEKEEYILALAGNALKNPGEVYSMFNNVNIKFDPVEVNGEKVPLTHGNYSQFLDNPDQDVRARAFNTYYKSFTAFKDTLAANYAGMVKADNFEAKARKFDNCLEKELFGDDVPTSVYTNLLDGIDRNLPKLHEYVKLRKRALGLKELHMYDMYLPIVKNADLKLSYEDACDVVKKALTPMGSEYGELLERAFKDGWIDVFENEGKRSGAYSWSTYTAKHPYVLLNYTEGTHDIFTIAHELGHAMHFYYSAKNQPYTKWGHQIFVAEVASTTNESLLLDYLLKTVTDKNVRKYLLSYRLDMFRTTIFRQTMFAEFEYNAHKMEQEGALSVESLSDMYLSLNKKYYGDGVIHDDNIRYEWMRIPHFYTSFYVYKYATGLLSATNVAKSILTDKSYPQYYIDNFLSAGGKKSAFEILCDTGVDLSKKEPYDKAFEVFNAAYDELEKLI